MSKKNDDFFVKKKSWSTVKDELLGCYFKPYVQKILHTHKPLIYIDCFAGKGKFDDGNPGSPLIALDILEQCKRVTKVDSLDISSIFIEPNYAMDLYQNIQGYPGIKIVCGKYEDQILNILEGKRGYNVFLYIDPFGIKSLYFSLFEKFSKKSFNSIEMLINLNSFGFIREACRALGTSFEDDDLFADLIEYDPAQMDISDKSIQELNDIAGGDYWQSIIKRYKQNEIDGYEAEALFSNQYCEQLKNNYTYVLNMPLRIKKGQRPKYRLIHVTNHKEGCLLMVDNICKRWEVLQEMSSYGQLSLFHEDFDNQTVDDSALKEKIKNHISKYTNDTSLNEFLCAFFMEYGPICSTGEVSRHLKILENQQYICVTRNPAFTKTTKKPTSFMTEKDKQSVFLRWNK